MESRDFIEMFVQKSVKQLESLRDYVHNFTTYLAKTVAIGNLTEQEWGRWFMRKLFIKYCRYIIEKTGAVVDEFSTFIFERLRQAIFSRMTAIKGAE